MADGRTNLYSMAILDVPANGSGSTASGLIAVRVQAQWSGPLTVPTYSQPLMRVSPAFVAPTALDSFGRPVGGNLTATSETVEEWGRLAVFVDGRDITYFRDIPASISSISWQRLGNFETAEFTIPGVSIFETLGVGDLAWLRESAYVRIARVHPDNSTSTIWLGTINAINPGDNNLGVRLTAHGLLFDANYRVAKAPVFTKDTELVQDLGYDIAATLNSVRGRWAKLPEDTVTGVDGAKEPSWETGLTYIQNLLALAVTNAGNAWTVWLDTDAKPSLIQTLAIPGHKTVTLVAGQDGVEDGLALDTLSGVTTVYGQGVTRKGAAWRNTKYPAATSTKPRYPLDDPDEAFGEGSSNGTTVSGNGVTKLQQRLTALGYTVSVTGYYGEQTTTQVTKFQKAKKLKQTGVVDLTTWNRLFSINDISAGAWIAPLASLSAVQPRLYDDNGVDIGPNPSYDPNVRPLEQFIDFGDGVSLTEATRAAQAIIARDGQRPTEGTLTLTVCPPEVARFDIAPGDKITYKKHWGENITLIVHRVEWQLDDTPSVALTVSTRDMDYKELDAAMNRIAQTNLHTKKPATKPKSSYGSSGVGAPAVPATPPTTGGGGGITGIQSRSASFVVDESMIDNLVLVDATGGNISISLPPSIETNSQVHFTLIGPALGPYYAYFASYGGTSIKSWNGAYFAGQYASATAIKISSTEWVIVGAMSV